MKLTFYISERDDGTELVISGDNKTVICYEKPDKRGWTVYDKHVGSFIFRNIPEDTLEVDFHEDEFNYFFKKVRKYHRTGSGIGNNNLDGYEMPEALEIKEELEKLQDEIMNMLNISLDMKRYEIILEEYKPAGSIKT